MKILPITNSQIKINSRQNVNKAQKNTPLETSTNPTFCGYKEVLKESFNKALDNKWDMGRLYQNLFDSAMNIPGATLTEKGKYFLIHEIFSDYKNFDNMKLALGLARSKAMGELLSMETLLKVNNTPIITRTRNSIEFSHPELNGSVEFWRAESSMDLYVKRPEFKEGFYDDDYGRHKEITIYSDWCTPTSTYYNRDGSEKKLRSFFGSMGF